MTKIREVQIRATFRNLESERGFTDELINRFVHGPKPRTLQMMSVVIVGKHKTPRSITVEYIFMSSAKVESIRSAHGSTSTLSLDVFCPDEDARTSFLAAQ